MKKNSKKNAIVEAILASCEIVYAPVKELEKSVHNCRHVPLSQKEIEELADNIAAVGLLQNLIGHKIEGSNKIGIAAGENRRLALGVLINRNLINPDYLVPLKLVEEKYALIVSYAENNNRKGMQPVDQIKVFSTLIEQNNEPAQIAASYGYPTRHVNKMVKLANMAPVLLDKLAQGLIDVDQLQALSVCDSQERQVEIWENGAHSYNGRNPNMLKARAADGKIAINNNSLFKFVGASEYEANGGSIERDLFSADNEGYITDTVLLESLALTKLNVMAKDIALEEGWSWSNGRIDQVQSWGDDANRFKVLNAPVEEVFHGKTAREEELDEKISMLEMYRTDIDDEQSDTYIQFDNAIDAMYEELELIKEQMIINQWTDEIKKSAGVVVWLSRQGAVIQRGIIENKTTESDATAEIDIDSDETHEDSNASHVRSVKDKGYSAALVASLTSERTLAVQAELSKQPRVAIAYLTHTLAVRTFSSGYCNSAMEVRIDRNYKIKEFAPDADSTKAGMALLETHEKWNQKLPEGWRNDFQWLLDWEQSEIEALLAYCLSLSINGVKNPQFEQVNSLDSIESAMNFNLLDYWKPTVDNFYKRISKDHMAATLKEAGMEDKIVNIAAMKKSDAAVYVEQELTESNWLPVTMKAKITA